MKNKEQFQWAVGVLVKAYFNNELTREICTRCAIGSLVKEACGYKGDWKPYWTYVHMVESETKKQLFNLHPSPIVRELGLSQIVSTGYTWQQTAKIELAFENGGEDMFDGLMSVVDCLIEIHEGSEDEKVATKEMFVR